MDVKKRCGTVLTVYSFSLATKVEPTGVASAAGRKKSLKRFRPSVAALDHLAKARCEGEVVLQTFEAAPVEFQILIYGCSIHPLPRDGTDSLITAIKPATKNSWSVQISAQNSEITFLDSHLAQSYSPAFLTPVSHLGPFLRPPEGGILCNVTFVSYSSFSYS
jgi:hypothetical protein